MLFRSLTRFELLLKLFTYSEGLEEDIVMLFYVNEKANRPAKEI